jgi:hypothetical protein
MSLIPFDKLGKAPRKDREVCYRHSKWYDSDKGCYLSNQQSDSWRLRK